MVTVYSFFVQYPFVGVLYAISVPLVWLAILAVEYGLNSGQLGRGRWWVFECLWEDILMNIPGGANRKAAAIRESVEASGPEGHGTFAGTERSWSYEELRKTGDYTACGKAMFGGAASFWLGRVLGYLFIAAMWPAVFVLMAIAALAGSLAECWSHLLRRIRYTAAKYSE